MTDADAGERATRPPMISDYGLALIVYILYLVGFLTGVSAVVGLIVATMQVERADPVSRTHFRFQIRTFWIGLLYAAVGAITLYITEQLGIPVSTTHTITGSIIGVGVVKRVSAVRWGVTINLLWAWVLTIPVSAVMAALLYYLLGMFI